MFYVIIYFTFEISSRLELCLFYVLVGMWAPSNLRWISGEITGGALHLSRFIYRLLEPSQHWRIIYKECFDNGYYSTYSPVDYNLCINILTGEKSVMALIWIAWKGERQIKRKKTHNYKIQH